MKLFELAQEDLDTAYYDPADDKATQRKLSDTRKEPQLTLKSLNKLKKMRAVKRLEALKRQDLFSVMYAPPADDGMGGMGGMGGGMGGF